MKKSKSLFSQLYKKAILYGLVDEGGWFPQMLASRKTIAEYTKLTKNFLRNQRNLRQKIRVNLCESVSNFPLCLGALVAETQLVRRSLLVRHSFSDGGGEGGSIKNSKLCETNPIFRMPKIIVSADMAITNSKNERSMYCQKQSQTNPNLPAIACLSSVALAKEEATAEAKSRDLLKQLPALWQVS